MLAKFSLGGQNGKNNSNGLAPVMETGSTENSFGNRDGFFDQPMTSVTSILKRIDSGSESARDQLLHRVYGELRSIANKRFDSERSGHLLQPTALVHEAFLRLFRQPDSAKTWNNSRHFYGAAANAMRQVLIDAARQRKSAKRGGAWSQVSNDPDQFANEEMADEVIALDESLRRLEKVEPQIASLVKLRFFVGLTNKEAAKELGIGARTANDYWAYARAWLRSDIQDHPSGEIPSGEIPSGEI